MMILPIFISKYRRFSGPKDEQTYWREQESRLTLRAPVFVCIAIILFAAALRLTLI